MEKKGRWHPGVSGNPSGRPKGARNKTTMAAMALLEGEAEMLTRRAIEAADNGDMSALKLVLDRIIPPRRRPVVQVDLEELDNFQDAAQCHRRIIQSALDGGLSLDEAERLSKLIIEYRQSADLGEYEWRAQRYLKTLFRRCTELKGRVTKLKKGAATGSIAGQSRTDNSSLLKDAEQTWKEEIKVHEDASTGMTLFVAALAYLYDCDEQEPQIERAWLALPASERERLREAQKYFPFVEIPED